MTFSSDGKSWSILGKLASNLFVNDGQTQTAAFDEADLIVTAEEMTSEDFANFVANPITLKKGILARLFLPTSTFSPADILAAFSLLNSEKGAPNAPNLARPLILFAPSFELQCLKALTAANIKAIWKVAGFCYQRSNGYSTIVSELERLVGLPPNLLIPSLRCAGFTDLRAIRFVCGYEKAVLSMQNDSTMIYRSYPELCKEHNHNRIKEPWGNSAQ